MYENIKLFQHDGECPLGIHFVGETLCDEKYCIERRNSDIASFEYIADGHGTLEINGQILHPKKGDIFMITEGSDNRYYSPLVGIGKGKILHFDNEYSPLSDGIAYVLYDNIWGTNFPLWYSDNAYFKYDIEF